MTLFKLLSALFEYPDEAMVEALPEVLALVSEDPEIEPAEREAIIAFVNWLTGMDITEAKASSMSRPST